MNKTFFEFDQTIFLLLFQQKNVNSNLLILNEYQYCY